MIWKPVLELERILEKARNKLTTGLGVWTTLRNTGIQIYDN
jgi:hypothetical protein